MRLLIRSLLLLMCLSATALSEAATLHVDADAPGPIHDGAGWGTAFKNIQDALAAAVSGDQIWVATGIYYPDDGTSQTDDDRAASFLLQSGVEIIGGFKGDETDVGQRDSAANPTVLSGDIDQNDVDADANGIAENPDEIVGANSFHVITASSVDSTALLDGFTITAGLADGLAAAEQDKGAGLLCLTGTTPVVQHCTLIGNRSDRGGAAYIDDASPTISASRFHANAAALGGGALYVFGDSDPILNDCEFLENLTEADGAAVGIAGVAHPNFNRCRFVGNSAGRDGGAIYNSGASPSLESCSFSGNSAADDGGGIYNIGTSSSVELINCSVSGNCCVDAGGGVYNSGSAGIPTFRNTIIWNNAADPAHPVVSQSIHNSRASLQPVFSNCLIQHLDLSAIESENVDGTDPANDPLFAVQPDPAVAPSREGDLRLQAVSPAIDSGNNAVIESPTDLSGNPRIHSAIVDLGAYEHAGPEVNPIPPLVLPFNVPVQSDILDLADVFDASATSFGLMGVDPPGMINVSLDGSNLEVSGISGAVLGTYRVRVWASDGTMQSSYTVTIFINAPRLYVDRGAPAGGDGSTWASALVSLQDAITLAADPAVDDEIWVSRGAYYPDEGAGQVANHVDSTFNLPPGLRIYGGFAGDEVSPDERDLRGHASILSGDLAQDDLDLDGNGIAEEPGELAGTNAKHVVTIESPETRIVLLDGLTISAGRAEGGADETQRGGAIYCLAGALELVHCQLSGNYAQKLGGAIYTAAHHELRFPLGKSSGRRLAKGRAHRSLGQSSAAQLAIRSFGEGWSP